MAAHLFLPVRDARQEHEIYREPVSGTETALLGRSAEQAQLEQELHEAERQHPSLVLITGPHGVGKTALLRWLTDRYDGPALWATGADWETDLAYGVFDQLLSGAHGASDAPREVAARLVRRIGPRDTTVVVVDDAHWADRSSLRALATAVRTHHDVRLLVVAAAVTGEVTVPSGHLDLLRRLAGTEVRLDPLTTSQVGELAAAHGVVSTPAMAERLCLHTRGITRHVVQLLDEAPADLWTRFNPDLPAPADVESRVREQHTSCSAGARKLAEAVAVLGPGTAAQDAARLAGISDELLPLLDEARAAGLVHTGPDGLTELAPPDGMVRAAVLAAMGPAATARAQRAAATLIEDPAHRLHLLVAASPVPDADVADELDALAGQRAAEGAWAVAASLLSDAARLTEDQPQRAGRLTRAVDALIGAGDTYGAAALLPDVESLRETPFREAVLGYLAIVRGRASEADSRIRRAWELVDPDRDPELAALISQRYVLHELAGCRPAELVAWADRAGALAAPDTPAALEAAAIRGLGLAATGRTAAAFADYDELASRVQHGAQAQRVVLARGWLNLMVDAVDDARADLESSVPTTAHGGSTRISLWARAWLARTRFVAGEWDAALRTVREASSMLDHTGIALIGPLLHWTAVSVHALRGEWEAAEQALLLADTGPQDYEMMRIPSLLARARMAEARADASGVLRALSPLARSRTTMGGVDQPGQWPWADMYAHALLRRGRNAEAEEFLTRQEQLAVDRGGPSARAQLAAARGTLRGVQGELGAANAAFEESLELLADRPLPLDRARVNLSCGQTLRRAGKRRAAEEVLTTAREIFAALGANTCIERCDRELRAGGIHSPGVNRGFDEFTPQEKTVADLVVRGLSNREVAAELFLSTKTVQYHLTRIYAKLGIRSRVELAGARGVAPEAEGNG